MKLKTKLGLVELNNKVYKKLLKYRTRGRRGLNTKNRRIQKKIIKENILLFSLIVKQRKIEKMRNY